MVDVQVCGKTTSEANAMLWHIYSSWDVKSTPREVASGKVTWPLPFHGDVSVVQLLRDSSISCNEESISAFKVALNVREAPLIDAAVAREDTRNGLDRLQGEGAVAGNKRHYLSVFRVMGSVVRTWEAASTVLRIAIWRRAALQTRVSSTGLARPPDGYTREVTWPEVQAVFRQALSQGTESSTDHIQTYPALHHSVTLRRRVEFDQIPRLLLGKWRVYCKAARDQRESSHTLCITSFDESTQQFQGHPEELHQGYELTEGEVEYINEQGQQHAYVKYKEVSK